MKTHVEHPVRLVEHEDLDVREVDRLLLEVIEQAARRRDDDVHAAPELVDLGIDPDAAEHDHRLELQVLAVVTDAFLDLGGEFARRREDQRADHGLDARRVMGMRAGGEPMKDRQGETGGLAGAGLRAGKQVTAAEHGRNGLPLDRGGRFVAEVADGPHEFFGEAEFCK